MHESWSALVTAIEADRLLLQTPDGQIIRWPRSRFSEDAIVGSTVHLIALSERDSATERDELARHVLNAMLKGT